MAYYQNADVTQAKLVIGNFKIETSATSGGTYVNLGGGIITAAGHNITPYEVQLGNAPDPIEGIADETFTIVGEMVEYDGSVLSAIQGGAISETSTSVLSTIVGGGNTVVTPRAFRITNTTMSGGSTVETIMTVYKGKMDTGLQFTPKSDNDSDPITIMPFSITAINDSTKTAGQQLFTITRTIV